MSAPQLKGVNYLARPIATYCDWLKKNGPKQLSIFGVDQPKANLARLLFPEIEEAGFACLPESFVDGVHADMDRCTRNFLAGPPLRFLRYWQTLSDDPFQCPKLALVFPEGYWPVMRREAQRIHERLVTVDGNVVTPAFWRKAA